MLIIAHRKNTVEELKATPPHYGVEVDIRSFGDKLIIHHDACVAGEDFDVWIAAYRHAFLVLNSKEEGLEKKLITIMAARGIKDYMFLDTTPPFTLRLLRGQLSDDGKPETRVAMRLSEYESADDVTAHEKAGLKAQWIWVDFAEPITADEPRADKPIPSATAIIRDAKNLQQRGYKICLVSPELYGVQRLPEMDIQQTLLKQAGLNPDAVCTKKPESWN